MTDLPVRVDAPRDYDGIGDALRRIYRDGRTNPEPIAKVLRRLDEID